MHVCQDPIPVCNINQNVPVLLSNMISILMAKNAEDRYQTMKGVVHDLDLMISEYDIDETMSSIELAQYDLPEVLILPQKLWPLG